MLAASMDPATSDKSGAGGGAAAACSSAADAAITMITIPLPLKITRSLRIGRERRPFKTRLTDLRFT